MRFAYADPPYPGQARKRYKDHPDYAGEVDHVALIEQLCEFDGWLLHTSSSALRQLLPLCPPDVRVFAWIKPFAVFKRNVSPAYAWEPVIVKVLRHADPARSTTGAMRDWLSSSIVLDQGLTGTKPEPVCRWLFEACGLEADDEFLDLFPGSGAVLRAWNAWRAQPALAPDPSIERDTFTTTVEGAEAHARLHGLSPDR